MATRTGSNNAGMFVDRFFNRHGVPMLDREKAERILHERGFLTFRTIPEERVTDAKDLLEDNGLIFSSEIKGQRIGKKIISSPLVERRGRRLSTAGPKRSPKPRINHRALLEATFPLPKEEEPIDLPKPKLKPLEIIVEEIPLTEMWFPRALVRTKILANESLQGGWSKHVFDRLKDVAFEPRLARVDGNTDFYIKLLDVQDTGIRYEELKETLESLRDKALDLDDLDEKYYLGADVNIALRTIANKYKLRTPVLLGQYLSKGDLKLVDFDPAFVETTGPLSVTGPKGRLVEALNLVTARIVDYRVNRNKIQELSERYVCKDRLFEILEKIRSKRGATTSTPRRFLEAVNYASDCGGAYVALKPFNGKDTSERRDVVQAFLMLSSVGELYAYGDVCKKHSVALDETRKIMAAAFCLEEIIIADDSWDEGWVLVEEFKKELGLTPGKFDYLVYGKKLLQMKGRVRLGNSTDHYVSLAPGLDLEDGQVKTLLEVIRKLNPIPSEILEAEDQRWLFSKALRDKLIHFAIKDGFGGCELTDYATAKRILHSGTESFYRSLVPVDPKIRTPGLKRLWAALHAVTQLKFKKTAQSKYRLSERELLILTSSGFEKDSLFEMVKKVMEERDRPLETLESDLAKLVMGFPVEDKRFAKAQYVRLTPYSLGQKIVQLKSGLMRTDVLHAMLLLRPQMLTIEELDYLPRDEMHVSPNQRWLYFGVPSAFNNELEGKIMSSAMTELGMGFKSGKVYRGVELRPLVNTFAYRQLKRRVARTLKEKK
jgi:hypothetical protein